MSKETTYSAAAYENDGVNAERLLKILKNCNIADSYSEFDEISQSHTIYVNDRDFTRAEAIIREFYEDSLEDEDVSDNISGNSNKSSFDDGRAASSPAIYADQTDRYRDNLSSAYTFLIFGVIGIVILVLYDFGLIPFLSMARPSKILFNVVMGSLFCGFIGVGIFSLKYSKRLKLQIDIASAKTEDITAFLKEHLTRDMIEESYSKEGLPEEMFYYKRIDAIKKCITEEFGEQPEDFINEVCDSYYENMFEQ